MFWQRSQKVLLMNTDSFAVRSFKQIVASFGNLIDIE